MYHLLLLLFRLLFLCSLGLLFLGPLFERVDKDLHVLDHDGLLGPVVLVGLDGLHFGQNLDATHDLAKNSVLPIEVLARSVRDKAEINKQVRNKDDKQADISCFFFPLQLRFVCVVAGVGHRENASCIMRQVVAELVLELAAPSRLAALAAGCGVAALNLAK